jgi:hypothetical protein
LGEETEFDRGRYEVVGVLGRSLYATVFEAHDRKAGDRVAVKLLSLAGSHRDIVEAMFRKEVDALDGFNHPAVVALRGRFVERDADRLGIVLELVPGGRTLEQLILDVAAGCEVRRTLRWRVWQLRRLLGALEAAHRRNVIHRDIKPSNVLVDRDTDELKLADFGIARILEHYGRGVEGATLRQFHTRPYAAPEQVLRGDATFASDLHAFGLLAVALLSMSLPARDFRPEQFPSLLEPLRAEVRDPALYQEIVDVLGGLLREEPSLRPRASAVERVLAALEERTTDRTAVPVRVTVSARTKAASVGCGNDAATFADLNDGLRARYEPAVDRRTGADSFIVRCYGKGLWAMLKPDDVNPEQLVLIDAGRNPGPTHARQRENALSVPFRLADGRGSSEAFVAPLFQQFEADRRLDEEKRKKQSLLKVAQFVLERQRERLMRLRISYRVADKEPLQRTAFGSKLAAAIGAAPEESTEHHEARGSHLHVKVLEVTPWVDEGGTQEGEVGDWTSRLDRKTPFLLDGIVFATFHGYDSDTKILSLRLKSPRKVPRQGSFECKDIALDASLKRQESAIDHFVEDACVNPKLGRLLLYPEENRLGDVLPRELMQPLEPKIEMQSLLERALAAEDFFFVQGPPGTGKTTLIAEFMAQLLSADPNVRILLTSQANEAVNNALDALRALGSDRKASWRLLRDVSSERALREGGGFEAVFAEWVSATRERSRKALEDLDATSPEGIEGVRDALARWNERLDRVDDVRQDYAESVQVFGVTCLRVPTLWRVLRDVRFDWVIVDEAAKATPAEVLVSLIVGRKFVMVGDHRQLPPFLDHETGRDVQSAGLDVARARRSLFEELFDKVPDTNRHVMRRQFRMHRSIGTFVGDLFYADVGGLETGIADEDRPIDLARFDRPHRVFWINSTGEERAQGSSWWNQRELDVVSKLLRDFDQELASKGRMYTVGVIAAYKAQAERLRAAVAPKARSWRAIEPRIDTVDAFQGKQVDVLVYSLVRVGEKESPFLSDRRRLNVAFSRGKRLLLIVGHRGTAENNPGLRRAFELIPRENVVDAGGLS